MVWASPMSVPSSCPWASTNEVSESSKTAALCLRETIRIPRSRTGLHVQKASTTQLVLLDPDGLFRRQVLNTGQGPPSDYWCEWDLGPDRGEMSTRFADACQQCEAVPE